MTTVTPPAEEPKLGLMLATSGGSWTHSVNGTSLVWSGPHAVHAVAPASGAMKPGAQLGHVSVLSSSL
jgi:hypothetical protein